MRFSLVILFLLAFGAGLAQSPLARTKWAQRERELWLQKDSGKIDTKEWYQKYRVEAGSLGTSFQAWFISKDPVKGLSPEYRNKKGHNRFVVAIPADYQITKGKGSKYIKLLIINGGDTTVTISRSDATVLGFSCFVKPGKEWIVLRGIPIARCGNGYFTEPLPGQHFMSVALESAEQGDGNVDIPFKVCFSWNGRTVESNEIKIKMHASQIERLREENKLLKQHRGR